MKNLTKVFLLWPLAWLLCGPDRLRGGSTVADFNRDPSSFLVSAPGSTVRWRPDGGASGANGDGFLRLDPGCPDQRSTVVLPDLENGLKFRAFTIGCSLRVGPAGLGSTGGFSISIAAATDPVITDGVSFAGTGGLPGPPENGTRTGVSVGFHFKDRGNVGGGDDFEGIEVRIDGEAVARYATTLATGPFVSSAPCDPSIDPSHVADALRWETLVFQLDEDSLFHLRWQGVELTPPGGLPMPFFYSEGRIVVASRSGAVGRVVDADNLVLTTIPGDVVPEIGAPEELNADPVGVELKLRFGLKPEFFRAWIDDEPAPCVSSTIPGGTRFRYDSPDVFFGAGIRHLFRYEVTLSDGYVRRRTLAFSVPPPLNVDELRGRLRIFLRPATGRAALEWVDDSRLFGAPTPAGPWTEVTNATTPYVLPDTDGTRYFRVGQR